jgi:hypothetical protein
MNYKRHGKKWLCLNLRYNNDTCLDGLSRDILWTKNLNPGLPKRGKSAINSNGTFGTKTECYQHIKKKIFQLNQNVLTSLE